MNSPFLVIRVTLVADIPSDPRLTHCLGTRFARLPVDPLDSLSIRPRNRPAMECGYRTRGPSFPRDALSRTLGSVVENVLLGLP